ncbi:MAG: IPTL-CTERM sorting domain-containing protein, partial [Planctomycetes bacterium]|nr:IPTL-CTERM sorting domain-containing protein [Planctomycetota bacterium]
HVTRVEGLVTGDAARIGNVVAGDQGTLKFYFTPRPPLPGTEPSLAYPSGWNITGQTLTVPSGGFTSAWITQIEGWDADQSGNPLLRSFQDKIDATSFLGVNASPPNPGCDLTYPASNLVSCQKTCASGPHRGEACSQSNCPASCIGGTHAGQSCRFFSDCPGGLCTAPCDDPCQDMLGEPGPYCGATAPGFCDWGWQNKCGADVDCNPPHRADWVMAADTLSDQFGVAAIVSPTGPNFAATANPGTEIFDEGIRYYTGTLLLPVPACARGTYTIRHKADETFAQDQAQPWGGPPIAALVTGVLEIPMGSCCTDFTTPSAATCTAGVTVGECNAMSSSNLHIFRDGVDCTTPCGVECVTATDCDDQKLCTADSCTSDGQCVHTHTDAVCNDGVACTTDVCLAASDMCVHTLVDAVCDDGLYCNGFEFCTATGCENGDAPCSFGETCDETSDSCGLMPIPTVSQWGIAVLAIMLLIAAKVGLRRPIQS